MAHVPRTAFSGLLLIDATKWKDLLFDLAPGAGRSLKTPKEGLSGVLDELPVALGQHAKALGIDAGLQDSILKKTADINALRTIYTASKKLTEIIGESIALLEDEREADVSMIADTVKRISARKDPSITAAFEKTLHYVSQIALKAAATRRKNAEGAEVEATGDSPDGSAVAK